MLVTIDSEVFNQNDDHTMRHLDRLLMLFETGRHEWYLLDDKDSVMGWFWPSQLSERHKSILKQIAEKAFVNSASITPNERRNRGVVNIQVNGQKTLANLISTLDDPLYIVVENETSDKTFLNRLFEIYPSPGKLLQVARDKGHLTYYPAGGRTETVKTLLNISTKKPSPYIPRMYVFVDSDKHFPGQEHNKGLQEIDDYCAANSIPLHITYKREIENYIPKEVLEKKLPNELQVFIDEFSKFNHDQWDFFDMEKGFGNNQPDEKSLYPEYSGKKNERYQKIRYGTKTKDFNPKKELYLFVDDPDFNAKTVDKRCAHQQNPKELIDLLSAISNYL